MAPACNSTDQVSLRPRDNTFFPASTLGGSSLILQLLPVHSDVKLVRRPSFGGRFHAAPAGTTPPVGCSIGRHVALSSNHPRTRPRTPVDHSPSEDPLPRGAVQSYSSQHCLGARLRPLSSTTFCPGQTTQPGKTHPASVDRSVVVSRDPLCPLRSLTLPPHPNLAQAHSSTLVDECSFGYARVPWEAPMNLSL